MSPTVLTFYVLMWPVIVAAVLLVIGRAFLTDWLQARRKGRDVI